MCVPGAQFVHGLQLDSFCRVVYVPVGQPAHTWSVVALPATSMNEPASQVPKGEQDAEFFPAANDPAAQATHTVSLVGVPVAATKLPAAQSETGLHAVAGSKSSSKVPVAQATAAASAPAQ